jgi:hypothetical protein
MFGKATAAITAMIPATTRISTRVKPACPLRWLPISVSCAASGVPTLVQGQQVTVQQQLARGM